ncbi:S8 family serine peptidase [Methanolobus sediminis]|uniref:S8 family serine peptidase n=1 Tax=Methanolobus sediminis TaxID=3072978 RepID=A0AA51UL17_9EURY|nr:S8 family serine peptidase [Methanolobus sediminis]WMW25524.1 S8 family serine peptidase [Methanolobus sediminis]
MDDKKKRVTRDCFMCDIFRKITMNKCKIHSIFLILILLFASIPSAYAVSNAENQKKNTVQNSDELKDLFFSSGELLIKIKDTSKKSIKNSAKPDDTGIVSLNKLNKKFDVIEFEQIATPSVSEDDGTIYNWYKLKFNVSATQISKNSSEFKKFKALMNSYELDPNIEVVELNYIINVQSIPDDPYFSSSGSWGQSYPDLWGMQKINTESAWDVTTGSSSVIVADIDTGVDRTHEDLKDNMWVNTAEIPDNGIDDDGNGHIDDYYGWDWANNDNDPMDDHGHGTHTAGTIAATGNNNVGVVGVSWNSKIMALKFLNSAGSGNLDDAVKAIKYAADMGARVSSNSWGSFGTSQMLDDAIRYAHDKNMVVVVAAGNSNDDALDYTPASADYSITVAASDYTDAKAYFSNWGQKIDVAAPGVDILSTKAAVSPMFSSSSTVDTNYGRASGTSMATPHVAGLAALLIANDPSLTSEEVRQIIRTGSFDLGTQGKDDYFGFGRIDAANSLSLSDTNVLAPFITSPASRSMVYGQSLEITGSASGSGFESYTLQAGVGRDPASWINLSESNTQVTDGILAVVDTTQLPDGYYTFRLIATNTDGIEYQFQVYDVEVDNFDAAINSPLILVSQGSVDLIGDAQTKNGMAFSHYMLEWGEGSSPASYTSAGISMTNDGLQPVIDGKLGIWDTSGLTSGQVYTLRLSVVGESGVTSQCSIQLTADSDLVSGWPILISRSTSSSISEATPTIADLDNDGTDEIVITSADNKIYVFRKDGSDYPGFPVSVTTGEHFTWPANVADLDNDGHKEIIAASVTASGTSKVYVLKDDGTFYPGWTKPVHIIGQQVGDGTPTIADLDSDGIKEMVVIDPFYKKMHAYHLDGSELTGFPKTLPLSDLEYPGAPLITDLNGDGVPEIAYGAKNKFYLFDNHGNLLDGWPFVAPVYNGNTINFKSSPACGDVDGDGDLEIVAIGHNGGSTSPIYAWDMDGSLLPNWPMVAGSLDYGHSPLNSPSLTDVDNDGLDEVVVGLSSLSIFDQDGQKSIGTGIGAKIAPAITDVDGDGKYEFSGVKDNKLQIGNDDGSILWQRVFSSDTLFLSPAMFSDIDNNGRMELTLVQSRLPNEEGDLIAYMWEMPYSGENSGDCWSMFLHDPQRSGRLAVSDSMDTVTTPPTDTASPTTVIASPSGSTILSGVVDVNVEASDDTGVSKTELYCNGVLLDTETVAPYLYSWDTTHESDGEYMLQSKAYDEAGNVGSSQTVTVTVKNNVDENVDTDAPVVSIASPLDGSSFKRKSTVTINAMATDNVAVTKVEFLVNGIVEYTDQTGSYSYDWKVPAKPGPYTLQLKAYDDQGNIGTSETITVTAIR